MAIGVPIADISDNNDTCYMIAYTDTDYIAVKAYNLDPDKTYYLRVFVRLTSDTSDITYNKVTKCSGNHSYQFTVSGLTPGKEYTMNFGDCPDSTGDGVDWWGGTEFSTYITDEPTILTPAVNGTEVDVRWKNNTGVSAMYVITTNNYIKDFGTVSNSTTTRTSTVTYDNYDTTYTYYVFTLGNDGTSNYSTGSVTTDPLYEDITIEIYSDWYAEGNIVTFNWEVLTGELDSYKIKVGTVDKTSQSTTTTNDNIEFTTKIPLAKYNTSYTITVEVTGIEGETHSQSINVITESLSKWYWNQTNTSTGWNENDALTNKGPFNTITAERWKAFVFYYNGLMEAAYSSGVINMLYSAVWENFEQMTATDFDGLVTQSNSMFINAGLSDYYTRPAESAIKKGKPIYGYYITDLTTAYNNLVDYVS